MKLAAIGSNCIDDYADLNGGTALPRGGPVVGGGVRLTVPGRRRHQPGTRKAKV